MFYNRKNFVVHLCLLSFLICATSCKKDNNNAPLNLNNNPAQLATVKANNKLLIKYVDYELKLEAKYLKSNSNPLNIDTSDLKMDRTSFEKMINNFLLNEKNIMLQSSGEKMDVAPNKMQPNTLYMPDVKKCYDVYGNLISCPATSGGQTVSCLGNFTGLNTTNTIVFVGGLNDAGNSVLSSGYAFGGFAGTWSPVGPIDQSFSQDVITYQQYYTDTYTIKGFSYTQIYLIYGNIYGRSCTVHGVRVINQ